MNTKQLVMFVISKSELLSTSPIVGQDDSYFFQILRDLCGTKFNFKVKSLKKVREIII